MLSKIKSITPEMQNGVQKSYDGSHGTMYTFLCTLENGTTGQVSAKSPAPHRFGPGDEVSYTFTPAANPNHTGKLKIEKPKEGEQASGGGESPRSSGWSPAKEASVMIQGLLKSVIESGAKSDVWEPAVAKALAIHDKLLAGRTPAAPAPTPAPAPQAVAKPQPVAVGDNEDDLPF